MVLITLLPVFAVKNDSWNFNVIRVPCIRLNTWYVSVEFVGLCTAYTVCECAVCWIMYGVHDMWVCSLLGYVRRTRYLSVQFVGLCTAYTVCECVVCWVMYGVHGMWVCSLLGYVRRTRYVSVQFVGLCTAYTVENLHKLNTENGEISISNLKHQWREAYKAINRFKGVTNRLIATYVFRE